jgi:pimeloyl-ACP methyl ester carboxylesterase
MPRAQVNDIDLHYDEAGAGPSAIMVHGSWGDGNNWARVTPLLAEHCRVVSYDRRGHSRSERLAAQGSVHEDVADLAALIERLDLAPVFVCGNSYGALITLRLAGTRSDLVRGIAVHEPPGMALLHDPATEPIGRAARERLAPVRALLEAGDDAAAAELFVDTVAFGPGAWAGLAAPLRETFARNAPTYLDEMRDPQALRLDLELLATYRKPALLTQSDDSPPMFAPILDRIAAVLPQAQRHVYQGAGHTPHAVQPEAYVKVTLPRVLAS